MSYVHQPSGLHYQYRPGQVVAARWLLQKPLGRGSFGEVWLAHDRQNRNEERALKFLSTIAPNTGKPLSATAADRARDYFIREVNLLKHLNLNDKLPDYRGDGLQYRDDDTIDLENSGFWVEMRYFRGYYNLDEIDRTRELSRNYDLAKRLEILKQVAIGLDYMHDHGCIHRDIKPSNIMVSPAADAQLIDLGVARWITDADEDQLRPGLFRDIGKRRAAKLDLTRADDRGDVLGTYTYIPPARRKRRAQPSDDLYAFVLTAYEVLTFGHYPFDSYRQQNTRDQISYLNEKLANFTANQPTWDAPPSAYLKGYITPAAGISLDQLFAEALAALKGTDGNQLLPEPQRDPRWHSATAFCDALLTIIQPAPEQAPAPPAAHANRLFTILTDTFTTRLSRPDETRSFPLTWMFAGLVVLSAAFGIALTTRQPDGGSEPTSTSVIAVVTQADTLTPTGDATRSHLATQTTVALAALGQTATAEASSPTPTPVPPTSTPTRTTTGTPTLTATATATATPSNTRTPRPTSTRRPTRAPEPTPTPSATMTPSATPTYTATPSATMTPSATATHTPTPSATATPSATHTNTPTPTRTTTPSPSPTPTATMTPTQTLTFTPKPTFTPTLTPSATPYPDMSAIAQRLRRIALRFDAFDCTGYIEIYEFLQDQRTNPTFAAGQSLLTDFGQRLYDFCGRDHPDSNRVRLNTPGLNDDFDDLRDFIRDNE